MRIDASGNVGIGTTSPASKLHIFDGGSSVNNQITFGNPSAAHNAIIHHTAAGSEFLNIECKGTTSGYGNIVFKTGGTPDERMRIASDGTLFHGRTSDFYMSDSMASKNLVLDGGTGANDLTIVSGKLSASTMYHIGFFNANSHVGNISTNGYNTTYTTSSDYRYKENVNYEWRGLEKINDLRPAQFNFINETEIQEGFIAHEAQKVTPYAVVGEKDGETKQTMDYGRITPLLVKAIQEQQKLIETLQAKVEALENG
jgi:hypothetical protein